MTDVLLSTAGITKEFSGVPVLRNISVELYRGEVLGIIGENGAGKSTFMKILSGIYTPTAGAITLEGRQVTIRSPIDAKELGIGMVPQEFNLIETLNVFENVFLGREPKGGPLLDKRRMREECARLFRELDTPVSSDAMIRDLSVAQKQMVEIAKALVQDSKLLILDEPTTVLTEHEIETLFRLVRKLKDKGVTMLFISHKLKEVKSICDRVMILRDGAMVGLDRVDRLEIDEMARRMVGRELSQIFPEKTVPLDGPALVVEELSDGGMLEDISFFLKTGEVLGFAGLVGAGRTELAEAIMGLRRRTAGRIVIRGTPHEIDSPRSAVNLGMAYLSEDRQGSGLVMNFTIPQNMTLISLAKYLRVLIDRKRERLTTERYVKSFNITAASLASEVQYLSGGNQQKVYLAKWMDTDPAILILDEPTRGIDVNAKREIYRFINELARRGISCIVISSEMEELIGLCTRVYVMREGRISGVIEGDQITEERIMYLAAGIKEVP